MSVLNNVDGDNAGKPRKLDLQKCHCCGSYLSLWCYRKLYSRHLSSCCFTPWKLKKKNLTSFLTICKLFDQVSMDIFVQIQCLSSTLICNKEFIQLSMFSLKINYHRAVEKDIQKTVLTPEQHIPVLAALFLFTPSLTFSIPSFSIQSCSRHCHISVHHDITFQQSRGRLPCVERTSPARCTCVSCASTRGVSNACVSSACPARAPCVPITRAARARTSCRRGCTLRWTSLRSRVSPSLRGHRICTICECYNERWDKS